VPCSSQPAWQPTKPAPFEFEEREAERAKSLTISQRRFKEEMVERQLIEEEEVNQPFRAKPVPESTLDIGRLDRMNAAAELRRNQRKEDFYASLKHAEFSFLNRDKDKPKLQEEEFERIPFKAKDCPDSSTVAAAEERRRILRIKEEARANRIKQRSDKLYNSAKLPKRMEEAAKTDKRKEILKVKREIDALPSGLAKKEAEERLVILEKNNKEETMIESFSMEEGDDDDIPYWMEECTFTPSINPDIPDYAQIQRTFEEKLQAAKASKPPTDPEPFNLLTAKIPDRTERILEDVARDNLILKEARWPYVSTRAPVPVSTDAFGGSRRERKPLYPGKPSKGRSKSARKPRPTGPSTTLAAELRQAQTRKLMLERKEKEIATKKEEKKRVQHQKQVNERVARLLPSKTAKTNRDQERKAERKRMIAEEKHQAAEMRREREDKLASQAPIWERTRMDMVQLRAQDAIEEIMATSGLR